MQLTGIEIELNGRRKFVGKCGICPSCHIPHLKGKIIFYKEEKFKNVISHKLQAAGIDRYAWDFVRDKFKCEGMVIWCRDTYTMILISADKISGSPIVDL